MPPWVLPILKCLVHTEDVSSVLQVCSGVVVEEGGVGRPVVSEVIHSGVEAGSHVECAVQRSSGVAIVRQLIQLAQHGLPAALGPLNIHADGLGDGGAVPSGLQQLGNFVVLGAEPVHNQRHVELAVDFNSLVGAVHGSVAQVSRGLLVLGQLLVTDAVAGILGAVSVVNPAALFQDSDSGSFGSSVSIQQDGVGICLVSSSASVVRSVDDGAVAAGEVLSELVPVDGVSNSLTDFCEGSSVLKFWVCLHAAVKDYA